MDIALAEHKTKCALVKNAIIEKSVMYSSNDKRSGTRRNFISYANLSVSNLGLIADKGYYVGVDHITGDKVGGTVRWVTRSDGSSGKCRDGLELTSKLVELITSVSDVLKELNDDVYVVITCGDGKYSIRLVGGEALVETPVFKALKAKGIDIQVGDPTVHAETAVAAIMADKFVE